ncbi:XdhC family protein (plasmid) [Streptomyces sp. NBC_01707]|uniref:XdhC family protein n=1 Tax=Streptomyces sp. NBC_01707 TaxID=2975914 RepID=UPI002F917514
MLEIAEELHRWAEQGRDFAVATVAAVEGSTPRGPGATLAVDASGAALGSVSGGCVEAAVYELCQQALRDRENVLQRFGPADDTGLDALTCGGTVEVLVAPVRTADPVRPVVAAALSAVAAGRAVALARVVSGPQRRLGRALLVGPDGVLAGGLGAGPGLDGTVTDEARAFLDAGRTGLLEIGEEGARCGGPMTLLVESAQSPPRMLVFGAIDFAGALVGIGKFLGYRVTVCDARPAFATRARFPEADEIVVEWPHVHLDRAATDNRTVLCVLTHDPKFDVPLLRRALRLPAAYVGAMGSRRTHLDRVERLREAGVTERELARLRSPIGLDLGARTPEETALSIAAEIVAVGRGGTGTPLTGAVGPIHHNASRRQIHGTSAV